MQQHQMVLLLRYSKVKELLSYSQKINRDTRTYENKCPRSIGSPSPEHRISIPGASDLHPRSIGSPSPEHRISIPGASGGALPKSCKMSPEHRIVLYWTCVKYA